MKRRHAFAAAALALAGGGLLALPGGAGYERAFVPGAMATPAPALDDLCTPGYTKTIRPPEAYTTALKEHQMAEHHLKGGPEDYEEDHLIPLSSGGNPTSEANLWPQPIAQARKKDVEEVALYHAICDGELTMAQARRYLLAKWGPAK